MAHTFDTKAQIAAATTNPQAVNYTCGSGATLLVVTLIYANGTRTGAPTYNGVSLTQADQVRLAASSPEACAEIWYMTEPPTGSAYSLSVPNPNALSLEVVISSYKAAANFTSIYDTATGSQNNSSANPSVTITTNFIDAIVAVVASGHDTWAPSARSGTQLYDTDNGLWGGGHQYFLQSTAGAKAMSWTQAADDWGMCVAGFREIPIGISASKATAYGILAPPAGISASKANVCGVLAPPAGVSVSKAVIYAVLTTVIGVTGSSVGTSTGSGTLEAIGGLAGSSAGIASATATLTEATPAGGDIAGLSAGTSSTTAIIAGAGDLAGSSQGTSTALILHSDISGSSAGVGSASATLENIGPVDLRVTQSVAEVLARPAAEITVAQAAAEVLLLSNAEIVATQTIAEVLRRANTDILVEQTVCEVLVSGWRRKTDFMPTLTRFF